MDLYHDTISVGLKGHSLVHLMLSKKGKIMRGYITLRALEGGETVIVDGIRLKKSEGDIKPGDFYIGERNTGPQLLVAREISEQSGCIHAEGPYYSYDLNECVKVQEV